MIILPSSPAVATVEPFYVDTGLTQRPPTRATITRIDRPGSHYGAKVSYPPMPAAIASVFISRLVRAKSEGLRMPFPLTGVSQGSPGTPEVNGSGAGGILLPVTGLTGGYQWKEGYWLNVVDADGVHHLHSISANGAGNGVIPVWPPLRGEFPDGCLVVMDAPRIEGAITSDISWPLPSDEIVTLEFTIEEAA